MDKNGNVYLLYAAISGPQLHYKSRMSGTWSARTAIDATSDFPSIMVRATNSTTYGSSTGALYWKSSTFETYFYFIPEFESVILPIIGLTFLVLFGSRRFRTRYNPAASS